MGGGDVGIVYRDKGAGAVDGQSGWWFRDDAASRGAASAGNADRFGGAEDGYGGGGSGADQSEQQKKPSMAYDVKKQEMYRYINKGHRQGMYLRLSYGRGGPSGKGGKRRGDSASSWGSISY